VVVVLINFLHMWMGINVGRARKTYGIPYPSLYAVPGTRAKYGPGDGESAPLKGSDKKDDDSSSSSKPLKENSRLVTDEEAYAFNCVQRGHQNFLENLPVFLALLFVNWFSFPLIAGWCGIVWSFFKIFYFIGYSRNVGSRMWGAGSYLALFTLFGLSIATAVFFFDQREAY
jgi:glutathione S-transferase